MFSTVYWGRIPISMWKENIQYCGGGGILSVLWRMFSNLGEGYHQCCEGTSTVLLRNMFSTVGRIPSTLWRMFSNVANTISAVEDVQKCGGYDQYCGVYSLQWRKT